MDKFKDGNSASGFCGRGARPMTMRNTDDVRADRAAALAAAAGLSAEAGAAEECRAMLAAYGRIADPDRRRLARALLETLADAQ